MSSSDRHRIILEVFRDQSTFFTKDPHLKSDATSLTTNFEKKTQDWIGFWKQPAFEATGTLKHFSLIVDFPYFELLNGISLVLNKRNWSPAIQNKGKPMATFFKDSTEELQMQIRVFFTEASGFLPLIKNGLVNKHNVESNQITQSNF